MTRVSQRDERVENDKERLTILKPPILPEPSFANQVLVTLGKFEIISVLDTKLELLTKDTTPQPPVV